jgi:hypothetical protein
LGEYFSIFNLDRREVIDPAAFGHGSKPGDFLIDGVPHGVLAGLLHLLTRTGSGRAQQTHAADATYGRWAGDRIAIIGDSFDGTLGDVAWSSDAHAVAEHGCGGWVNISEHVVAAVGGQVCWEFAPGSALHPDGSATSLTPLGECADLLPDPRETA